MGYMDNKVKSALQRQKGSILKEAEKTGTSVLEVKEYSLEEASPIGAVSSSLKTLVGGKLRVDNVQLYQMRKNGFDHVYLQPFSGFNPLPGEHHAIVKGNFINPIAFTKATFGGGKWDTKGDKDLEQRLKEDRDLKRITNQVEWEWALGMGAVKLEWTIQLCPLSDGTSHLVLKAGRYGGITTILVGIKSFLALSQHLTSILPSQSLTERQNFLIEPEHADLSRQILSGGESIVTSQSAEPDASQVMKTGKPLASEAMVDFTDLIRSALKPMEGKKVHVDQLPEKKEKNVRKHVLPASVKDAPIVAVIDITMMISSAKDAIVFTPHHCYAKEIDDIVDFPLADLELVHGFTGRLEDKIDVEVRRLGRLTVPCGGEGTAALAALQRIAAHS